MLYSAVTPRGKPLWQLVCEQLKNQTRRPKKAGDIPFFDMRSGYSDRILWVTSANRLRYKVGQDYAVQPKRGQPAVRFAIDTYTEPPTYYYPTTLAYASWLPYSAEARIEIAGIRSEDVREISDNDAKAEGFESRLEFWQVWTKFYLPNIYKVISHPNSSAPHEWAKKYLEICEPEFFQAWALTFELKTAD